MRRVGLTGGVASGKSTVSAILAELGAVVVDADLLAREVVAPGTDGLAAIVEAFGPEMLPRRRAGPAGMGALVFADPERRRPGGDHPPAGTRPGGRDRGGGARRRRGRARHPLLAETGQAANFDAVVVVDVPAEVQVERMISLRGLTGEDARARVAAQATREERLAIATYVMDNAGRVDELRARVEEVFRALSGRPSPRPLGGRRGEDAGAGPKPSVGCSAAGRPETQVPVQ